jgi:hypothetical protein
MRSGKNMVLGCEKPLEAKDDQRKSSKPLDVQLFLIKLSLIDSQTAKENQVHH